jgi:hypothetical protein
MLNVHDARQQDSRAPGTLPDPNPRRHVPHGIFNLRLDPYERADVTSNTYYDWLMSDGAGIIIAGPAITGRFLATFKEFPPSQRPSSFSIDQIVEKLERSWEAAASK